MRVCESWAALDCLAIARHCGIKLPEVLEGVADSKVCFGEQIVGFQRALVVFRCLDGLSKAEKCVAKVVVRDRVVGCDFQRATIAGNGIVKLPERFQRIAKVCMRFRQVWVDP